MTDFGTTGIQVAPKAPTEDEMNQAQSILSRAISALVGMSQLQADVDMLRSTVQSLQTDTERYRRTIGNLDETLAHVRSERDAAQAETKRLTDVANQATTERDSFERQVASLKLAVDGYADKLHVAEQGRDDAELKLMDLEDQLKATQTKLDAIKDGFKSIFGDEPKAATPIQPIQPIEHDDPVHGDILPIPTDPTPPIEYLTSTDWQPGYNWDSTRQCYTKRVEPKPDGEQIPF